MAILRYIPFVLTAVCFFVALPGNVAHAQTLHNDEGGLYRAKVLEVISEEERIIPGTDTVHTYQEVVVLILEGPQEGSEVTIENDYLELEEGDYFYMNHAVLLDGTELYGVISIDRTHSLLWLFGLFVLSVIVFGGWQGVRALIALAGSFVAIFYILIPSLLAGWSPLILSFSVAGVILFAAIFFTHGFNLESFVAYVGTMVAVTCTIFFAMVAVAMTSLSGFTTNEAVYLNFNTRGELDFTGLLLGSIIIGVLGVLDDIAITQAAVVSELYGARSDISRSEVFQRAMRVGREHVGALMNTLVLAYTGASLPLLLLVSFSSSDVLSVINTEIFATEIVRTIVGSMGLVLTVPIVTGLAVWLLHSRTHTDARVSHTHKH